MQLEAARRETPDDPDAILALASHYDDQAFTGLLDATREQDCRVKATDGYETYLRLRPDDAPVEFRLARLLLRRGASADAATRLRALADAGYPTARLWLMESLFRERRYPELRRAAAAYGDRSDTGISPEASAAIDLWTDAGAAA
jgi:hypothetical protein